MTTVDRIKHAAALALIGDGVVGAFHPRRDAEFWKQGPASWRNSMRWFQQHPNATRVVALAQAGLAVLWVLHQERGA